jgi:hypothetical protein
VPPNRSLHIRVRDPSATGNDRRNEEGEMVSTTLTPAPLTAHDGHRLTGHFPWGIRCTFRITAGPVSLPHRWTRLLRRTTTGSWKRRRRGCARFANDGKAVAGGSSRFGIMHRRGAAERLGSHPAAPRLCVSNREIRCVSLVSAKADCVPL